MKGSNINIYNQFLWIDVADPSKEVVALGQTYFAVQTRKMELTEQEYGKLTEDEKEKQELGYLYTPTQDMKTHRFSVQDACMEYNKLLPSQVKERRDFLSKILVFYIYEFIKGFFMTLPLLLANV